MFSADLFSQQPGEFLFEDACRQVELAFSFRKLTCGRCDFAGFYRFKVQQLRRRPKISTPDSLDPTAEELRAWTDMPKFAEIPETVKCRRCGEVLGLEVFCIF